MERNKLEAVETWIWRKLTKTSWVERKGNKKVLDEVKEKRSLIKTIGKRRAKLIRHVLRRNQYLTSIIEGKVVGKKPSYILQEYGK